jgi:glycosidase
MRRTRLWASCLALAVLPTLLAAADYRARLPEDEVVYFVLPDRFENGNPKNDRGGLRGDRLTTGFDPAHKGFYHGGDLAGLIARLDYIQGLGATAIWLGPIYKNKPVQGPKGQESAGYHGYWITDFTSVDPHFGTEAEMRAFVDAVHARGMKVYLDIITNHTADVIGFAECMDKPCTYRSLADFPYSRKGGPGGEAINEGFAGQHVQTDENFAKLKRADFAYTPVVLAAEKNVKVPAWLNDPIYYHNRGNSEFRGESSLHGDFVGLDDLLTENPRVVRGFIDIYGAWIEKFGVDGFRIDTARHVNAEFWQAFSPAMLNVAKKRDIPNFHIFGEVAAEGVDVAQLARHTRVDKLPAVLDFAFANAVGQVLGGKAGTSLLARVFADDGLYEGGASTALRLPTFTGNHDFGRLAWIIQRELPNASREELLRRTQLGNALMFLLRGVPVVYYGDEQGFVGHGVDQDSRQDMFASRVPTYNDQSLLGSARTTSVANFDTDHSLYRQIATLAALRKAEAGLRRGRQVVRAHDVNAGLFAASRFDPTDGAEILVAFNTSSAPMSAFVEVDVGSMKFQALAGRCANEAAAPGSLKVELPPFGYLACKAVRR